jgi:hypothetical protein
MWWAMERRRGVDETRGVCAGPIEHRGECRWGEGENRRHAASGGKAAVEETGGKRSSGEQRRAVGVEDGTSAAACVDTSL